MAIHRAAAETGLLIKKKRKKKDKVHP